MATWQVTGGGRCKIILSHHCYSTFDASSKETHTRALRYWVLLNKLLCTWTKLHVEWRAQQKAEWDPQNTGTFYSAGQYSLHMWNVNTVTHNQFLKAQVLNPAFTWMSFPIMCPPPEDSQASGGLTVDADSKWHSPDTTRKQCQYRGISLSTCPPNSSTLVSFSTACCRNPQFWHCLAVRRLFWKYCLVWRKETIHSWWPSAGAQKSMKSSLISLTVSFINRGSETGKRN